MHVNDSKTPFDSHRDRHENIGRGSIPMDAFRWIMNNPKFQVLLAVHRAKTTKECLLEMVSMLKSDKAFAASYILAMYLLWQLLGGLLSQNINEHVQKIF